MTKNNPLNHDEFLMILNFTTRLLVLELDTEPLCKRALESISDFCGNSAAALLLLAEKEESLRVEGLFADRRYVCLEREIPWRGTPLEEVLKNKQYGLYPALAGECIPLPASDPNPEGKRCLCLPLASASAKILGIITIGDPPVSRCRTKDLQSLIILTTVIAISIENAHLFKQATRDGLTGLYIRTVFDIRLREELARLKRYGGSFTLLLIDIDHFKKVNDTLGHNRGDEILRGLADVIRGCVRDEVDIVCRYGGDEFIALMTAIGNDEALQVAERIRRGCEAHDFPGVETGHGITTSIGLITVEASSAVTEKQLLDRVDQMLYRAKSLGRNRICVWP